MSQTTLSDLQGSRRADGRAPALSEAFSAARQQERAALVTFVTAGHPAAGDTLEILRRISAAGADVIELGVPFSDPLADGPIIQRSSHLAIQQGVDLKWTLDALSSFREESETPVVLFTYLNPVMRYGADRFLVDALGAGAQGVLLTDVPVGFAPEIERRFAASDLDLIRLVAPTTTRERAREIAAAARGFLYYVSRTGVTGAQTELAAGLKEEVEALRSVASVPIAVGFGIGSPEQARTVAAIADGVVVGSALVRTLETAGIDEAEALVARLSAAMYRR
jgi:tryptophan synthase alpha chain